MNISEKKIVSATYDLYVDGEDGKPELMEQATNERPLTFCFGVGMMLPKFEEQLAGLKAGDKFDFGIACEDAYGLYDDESVIELEKKAFEIDGEFDAEVVKEGGMIPLMDNEGNRINAMVVSIDADKVKVDLNHPLAGENLHFKGEVIDVHEASAQELSALFGGCNCGCGQTDCEPESCGSSCGCH